MKISRIDYHLPPELIAQHPCAERTGSRLLVVRRAERAIEHRRFTDLPGILETGDLLVLNNTRVRPVRHYARRKGTGGIVELFLLQRLGDNRYRAMTGSGGRLMPGEQLKVSADERGVETPKLVAELVHKYPDGTWDVDFSSPTGIAVEEVLAELGRMPLPPYIKRPRFDNPHTSEDRLRYQTVYACMDGAVAAPTAGLHFTDQMLIDLAKGDVGTSYLTLHVGPGTFKPVKTELVENHPMHQESFELPAATALEINNARATGGQVVAVGTTTTRVLESCVDDSGHLHAQRGDTDLMILPDHQFRAVDVLLTNFHLPKSTLLALVMAFAGEELVREAYRQAIEERYRFFSYGDAMLLI